MRLGELIASGHLVPPRTFVIDVGVQEQLRAVRKSAADYDMTEVAQIMNRAPVTDEVVRHWQERASARRTVVFCSTVAHAENGREHHSIEVDLDEFAERVAEMPPLPGAGMVASGNVTPDKPRLDDALVPPVREGGQDDWSRFEGASAAIGHFIRMVHEGRMSKDDGWQAICGYNAAMLRPFWPIERLQRESERLWDLHVQKNGPALVRLDSAAPAPSEMPTFTLGALLDDTSPMPEDIVAPRVLTPGGLLVLGGAPKVGKSDLTISWLVHMAAGQPFLGFTPPRPLRVFYLQAEIQYHYLRERLGQIALPARVLAAARDTFVATPKLKLLLDTEGSMRVARAIQAAFPDTGPDVICIDPIRNLFDGGPDGGGENDNTAMMFFLKDRVEALRDYINPACGVILVHHTRKLSKQLRISANLRWEQRIWAAHNVTPDGGVSAELFAAQMEVRPAPTIAPETLLEGALAALDTAFARKHGRSLLRDHETVPSLLRRTHFFRAAEAGGILELAKELTRLFTERVDVDAILTIVPLAKGENKIGSLKALERWSHITARPTMRRR